MVSIGFHEGSHARLRPQVTALQNGEPALAICALCIGGGAGGVLRRLPAASESCCGDRAGKSKDVRSRQLLGVSRHTVRHDQRVVSAKLDVDRPDARCSGGLLLA